MNTTQSHCIIILDRVYNELPPQCKSRYFVPMSEEGLASIRGFQHSQQRPPTDMVFAPGPILGAVIDENFVQKSPETVKKLEKLAPALNGTQCIFNYSHQGDSLANWLLERAFGFSGRLIQELGDGQLEIARLQRSVLENFEALNAFQNAERMMPVLSPRLVVFIPPTTHQLKLSSLREQNRIAQSSKRELRAVHAIELCIANTDVKNQTKLNIRILSAYSRIPLCSWTLPICELVHGWNRFECSKTDQLIGEPILIEFEWRQEEASDVALALGEITADPRLAYSIESERTAERPLALRVFEGFPGVQLTSHRWGRLPDGEIEKGQAEPIVVNHLLEKAKSYAAPSSGNDSLLKYIDNGPGLLLHPLDRGVHIAAIENVQMDNIIAVIADIALVNDQAASTDFGLLASTSSNLLATTPSQSSGLPKWAQRASRYWSGSSEKPDSDIETQAEWMRLSASESGQLIFEPSQPLGSSFNIYLMTRQTGSGTSFAWSHFTNLAVIKGPRSK